jgi:hypothetical protein
MREWPGATGVVVLAIVTVSGRSDCDRADRGVTAIPPPETAPPNPYKVESVVAAIGFDTFASRSLRKVHGHHIDRAENMPQEVTRKIHLFLNRDEPAEAAELPPFDFDEVVKQLDAPIHPQHVEQEMAAFGEAHTMAIDVNLKVQQIRAYLQSKIPRRVYMSLAGPEPGEPPRSDIARFRRLWVIACDPLSILDDLNEFAVSRDQVTGISELYPALWGSFWPTIQHQLVRRSGVEPSYRLSRRKESLLRVLTKQEAPNYPLARALQQIFAEDEAALQPAGNPAQPIAKSPSAKDDPAASQATPAQQIANV